MVARTRSYKHKIPWPIKTPGGPNPRWVEFFRERTETRYRKDNDRFWAGASGSENVWPPPTSVDWPYRDLPFADKDSNGFWRSRGTITSKAYKWGGLWKRWVVRVRVRLNQATYAPGASGAVKAGRNYRATQNKLQRYSLRQRANILRAWRS